MNFAKIIQQTKSPEFICKVEISDDDIFTVNFSLSTYTKEQMEEAILKIFHNSRNWGIPIIKNMHPKKIKTPFDFIKRLVYIEHRKRRDLKSRNIIIDVKSSPSNLFNTNDINLYRMEFAISSPLNELSGIMESAVKNIDKISHNKTFFIDISGEEFKITTKL